MKRHALPGLLALIALACMACTPEPPHAPAVHTPAVVALVPTPVAEVAPPVPEMPTPVPDLLGWWDRPEALASLGLNDADGAAVATELRKFERLHQTAQRQLYTVKRTQLQMLHDPQVPSGDIRRFHQRNTLALATAMQDADIAARITVREDLDADQLARVLERSPEFFRLSWFRAAEDPQ